LILGLGLGRANNSDFLRTVYALNSLEQNRMFRQQQQIRQQMAAQRARADRERISATLNSARSRPRYVPSPAVVADDRVSSDVLLCWEVFGATFLVATPDEVFKVAPAFRGGMRVGAIRVGGPADRAGWEAGDVIVGLHRYKIRSYDNLAFVAELPELAELTPLDVRFIRDGVLKEGKIDVLFTESTPGASASPLSNGDPAAKRSLTRPAAPAEPSREEENLLWNRVGIRGRTTAIDRPGVNFKNGVSVVAVRPGGPADQAGIKSGEVIVGLSGYQTREIGEILWVAENPEISGGVGYVVVGSGNVRRGTILLPDLTTKSSEAADAAEPSDVESVPAEPALPTQPSAKAP
jgi:membrane-associated protease RseP (regulator of RpoE activity)